MSALPSFSEIGVVFDLDGVLIDSHDQHERSWFQLAAELGQSRAAVINLAIHRAVERGFDIDGLGKA